MKILIILNREPYDSTDVTWNSLRLADKLVDGGNEVRLFLTERRGRSGARRLPSAGRIRPGLVEAAQGAHCSRNSGKGMRNLHGAMRHLQEPSLLRGRREIYNAGIGGLG